MRKFRFEQNSYFHICNRSNDHSTIFLDERDYARFLFLILYFQAPTRLSNISRNISYYVKHSMFNIPSHIVEQITNQRKVELVLFTIMPNHFHLLAQEKTESGDGIYRYLQRVQNGYAKYFNSKYKKNGHLFQGTFRAVPVKTDEQLLYLSAYIHRNPHDLMEWKNKEVKYPWSSYQDCVGKNRWGELLKPDVLLDQFSDSNSYQNFVDTSTAKLRTGEISIKDMMLD